MDTRQHADDHRTERAILMMFWIAVAVITVVLLALARWSSGRARARTGAGGSALGDMATKRQGYGAGPST
jgi:hypothetical protein